MLSEFARVGQSARGFRRLFTDDDLSLYVWYPARGGPITGFQLVYAAGRRSNALTWTGRQGYLHGAVADGDGERHSPAPLLVAGDHFDRERVLRAFRAASARIDPQVRELVLDRLRHYPG